MIRPLTDEDTDWVPEKRQRTEVVTDNNHIPKTPHLKARNLLNHLREYTFTPAVDKFTEYLRWYEKKNGAPSPLSSSRSVTYVHTCLYMDYYASFFVHLLHMLTIITITSRYTSCLHYQSETIKSYLWGSLGAPTVYCARNHIYPSVRPRRELMGR